MERDNKVIDGTSDATTIREGPLGKFHLSPLTEGTIVRPLAISTLLSSIGTDDMPLSIELDISLNDWEGEGMEMEMEMEMDIDSIMCFVLFLFDP